ncbi:MAG: DUF4258 domain-containing protein [Ottowia sp.]
MRTYQNDRYLTTNKVPRPSRQQLERHIRDGAANSGNVRFTKHAHKRMRQRGITNPMVMEALRKGCIRQIPEPDIKFPGVKCRMERLVSGVLVGAVVYAEYPAPELVIVTVVNVGE